GGGGRRGLDGGSGGAAGADAATGGAGATGAIDAGPPPDGPATSPDAATALGPFPLAAVKAMTPQPYRAANAHLEGPSYRFKTDDILFAADGAGWGLMRVDADRKLYRYHPKLSPVGSYLLADGSLLVCDHKIGRASCRERGSGEG